MESYNIMRTIAVINQKGGVGKTTTSINVSHALALEGKRVLAIDMDPQGQLGVGLGAMPEDGAGIDRVLLNELAADEVTFNVRPNLDVIPAGMRLTEVEHISEGGADRGWRLDRVLKSLTKEYDFVLIDCPPSAGLLGMNALFASDEVLVPVSGDYFGLHGLSRLMELLEYVEQVLARPLKRWVAVTRFHERRRLARDVRSKLMEYFPGQVLETPVRETVALAESPGFMKTIFEYQGGGRGADDYRALAADLVNGRTVNG